jgi:hypothetical protein
LVESPSRFSSLFEHDLFGKPVSTFPDHALAPTRLLSSADQQDVRGKEGERQGHTEARKKQLCGFSHFSPSAQARAIARRIAPANISLEFYAEHPTSPRLKSPRATNESDCSDV